MTVMKATKTTIAIIVKRQIKREKRSTKLMALLVWVGFRLRNFDLMTLSERLIWVDADQEIIFTSETNA